MTPPTVLLVEDNAANRLVFEDLLRAEGYQVHTVQSAEEAIPAARTLLPQLILMDLQLPGMDGLTASRILREDKLTRNIPIFALTSYAMPGDRQKALVAGCNGYISKPIRIQKFREEIRAVLENLRGPGPTTRP